MPKFRVPSVLLMLSSLACSCGAQGNSESDGVLYGEPGPDELVGLLLAPDDAVNGDESISGRVTVYGSCFGIDNKTVLWPAGTTQENRGTRVVSPFGSYDKGDRVTLRGETVPVDDEERTVLEVSVPLDCQLGSETFAASEFVE